MIDLNSPQLERIPSGESVFIPNHVQLWVWRKRRELIKEAANGLGVNVVMHCGRRVGKTRYAIQECRAIIVSRTSGNFSMIVPDKVAAEDNWREAVTVFKDISTRANLVNAKEIEIVRAKDDDPAQFIRMTAATKGSTGRGAHGAAVLFDEAQLISPNVISRMLPAIVFARGTWFMTLTPPSIPVEMLNAEHIRQELNEIDWIKHESGIFRYGFYRGDKNTLYVESPTQPIHLAQLFYVTDCLAGTIRGEWSDYMGFGEAGLERMKTDMNKHEDGSFDRECLLNWGKAISQYCYRSLIDQAVSEANDFRPGAGNVFIAADTGAGDALTVFLIGQETDNGVIFFDEFHSKSPYPEMDMLADVLDTITGVKGSPDFMRWSGEERRLPYGYPAWAVSDPRAPRMVAAMKQAFGIMNTSNVPAWAAYLKTKEGMRTGRIGIHPRCKTLIANAQRWTYDGNTNTFSDKDCDAIQTLQYGFVGYLRRTGEWTLANSGIRRRTNTQVLSLPLGVSI